MLTAIHPKLPMRNKVITRNFYSNILGFQELGIADFEGYLMVKKDNIEIHFFEFPALNPLVNYGQVYVRTNNIKEWYQLALDKNINIPTAGHLQMKPWLQEEFAILDPDHNLITFGQDIF